MMKTSLTIVALFCSYTLVAAADDASSKARLAQLFKNFDTNGDGGISLEEYKAGMVGNMAPERMEKVFHEKDRNKDGKLHLDELAYVPQDQRTATPTPEKKDVKKDDKPAKSK